VGWTGTLLSWKTTYCGGGGGCPRLFMLYSPVFFRPTGTIFFKVTNTYFSNFPALLFNIRITYWSLSLRCALRNTEQVRKAVTCLTCSEDTTLAKLYIIHNYPTSSRCHVVKQLSNQYQPLTKGNTFQHHKEYLRRTQLR
jgi:hypothetical protein